MTGLLEKNLLEQTPHIQIDSHVIWGNGVYQSAGFYETFVVSPEKAKQIANLQPGEILDLSMQEKTPWTPSFERVARIALIYISQEDTEDEERRCVRKFYVDNGTSQNIHLGPDDGVVRLINGEFRMINIYTEMSPVLDHEKPRPLKTIKRLLQRIGLG